MTYTVADYADVDQALFFRFCKEAFIDVSMPAHANMWDDEWETATHTLPYLLEIEKRFEHGKFCVLYHNKEIIGCSGVYQSDFSKDICLVGIRSWIHKAHRGKFLLGRYVYPEQIKWAKQHNYKHAVISFNDYNKDLRNVFLRNGLGIVKNRQVDSLFYNGVNEVDFPVEIKYTKQWILYEKLDPTWEFDYSVIRYKEE